MFLRTPNTAANAGVATFAGAMLGFWAAALAVSALVDRRPPPIDDADDAADAAADDAVTRSGR